MSRTINEYPEPKHTLFSLSPLLNSVSVHLLSKKGTKELEGLPSLVRESRDTGCTDRI